MVTPALIRIWPLAWPPGRPRTIGRQTAAFSEKREGEAFHVSLDTATARLLRQLGLLGARYPSLATNVRFNADGTRDRTTRGSEEQADPGAVVRFLLAGRDYELACDKWDRVGANVAAIAAHIDALRGQERWGVADLATAFAGHVALPAPDPWWDVLGIARTATRAQVDAAYRHAARFAHPDAGGDRATWERLASAYTTAKQELDNG